MGDLGNLIGATGFEKLLKVQYNAQSGHTECRKRFSKLRARFLTLFPSKL